MCLVSFLLILLILSSAQTVIGKLTLSISAWTFKWRMKLNTGKTECVLFTRDPNHTVPLVELQGKALKCTEEVKLL